MKTTAYFGPPGTGKTTHLAEKITTIAKTTPNMAVISFTKAAAGVLTSRLMVKIRYIGTIHAMAFHALSLSRDGVADDIRFAKWYGADVEEVQVALSVHRYQRHNKTDIATAFSVINPVIPFIRIEHLIQSYLNWKSTYQYLDFDDMIKLATGKVEPFDVVVVDEAQDCTNEQWDFIRSILKPTSTLVIGGDDDQALFTWAGANPHAMEEMADGIVILGQSHRIPRSVHRVAEATVGQISQRVTKEYKPTDQEGKIECVQIYEPMWYPNRHTVLCRDKWSLREIEKVLIERGLPYTRNGEQSMFDRGRCSLAKAIALEDFGTIKRLSKYLRKEYRESEDGAITACKVGWQKALDFGTWEKEARYLALIDPTDNPLIHLSTIHRFKGEEDNHIILNADCTSQVQSAMDQQEAYDNELRVWYVGLTRCRTTLTIVGWNQFLLLPKEHNIK